jgi:transcriptional regulator with XRE-family HTH domain
MDIGQRIKLALEERGLSVREAAGIVGISVQAMHAWIRGEVRNIRPANLFAIADATGFSARWLATGEGTQRAMRSDLAALIKCYEMLDDRSRTMVLQVCQAAAAYEVK